MSFTKETFAPVSSHSSNTPNVYSYKTDDTLADVEVTDYFDEKAGQVEDGDFFLVYASDGSSLLRSVGGKLTPTSSVSLNNLVTVQSLSDLPDPVGSVISLQSGFVYEVNGIINLAGNRIATNGANALIGNSSVHDGFIYTGTGALFTSIAGESTIYAGISCRAENGTFFDVTGDGNNIIIIKDNCDFSGSTGIGSLSDMRFLGILDTLLSSNDDGIEISGTNSRFTMRGCTIFGNDNEFIDLGSSTWESFVVAGNQAITIPSGATFLSGAASSANIVNAATIQGNIFSGAGDYLDTIANEDLKWEFLGNKGNKGTQDSQREGGSYISTSAPTVITTGSGDAGNPIPIVGTFTETIAKRFTTTAAGLLTYIGLEFVSVDVIVSCDLDPASGANKAYVMCVAVNGACEVASRIQVSIDANNPSPVMCQFPVSLGTSDTLQAYIENITDETNVTATSLSIVAR